MALLSCGLLACWSVHAAVPAITQQPQRTNVVAGDNASFTVAASGTEPLSYQWQFSSTNLPLATNGTLVISNAQVSHAGAYQVVVSNAEGSTTSATAHLTVRSAGTSIYLPPPGGWTYRFEGDAMATAGAAALDGTWNHNNGTDAWAGDSRGSADAPPGGLSVSNGVLTLEDVVVSGGGDDNRRLYFTHPLAQDPVTNANTILNDGVTFTFRARLTPATDPLTELTNAPNGFINVSDGKGMIGMRQSGSSGMIISFSLSMASEDTNATTLYHFPAAGLHMNNLNGNNRTDRVDPGELGSVNVFPVDPEGFHEFWITIEENGTDPGTHRVSVYADGSTTPSIFNVTAGIGVDTPITNYLAIGLPSAVQRGAFDLDWVGYKQGVHAPTQADVPVEIVGQPANQTINEGQTATFTAQVTGTPPISFQWFRNGMPISGATAQSYTTGPLLPPDNGAVFTVQCQNVAGSVTSDPAVLTVIGDSTPPTVISAASLNGQTVGVCFSERVTSASAQNFANYTINGAQVTSATLRSDGTTVLLQVAGLGTQVFSVTAANIVDASFAGNSGGGTVQGIVHGLTAVDIGAASGSTFTCASNRFELMGGGAGLGGTADEFHFASMPRTGDFDVRVRVAQVAGAQAGLVARVDQTTGSRSVNAFVSGDAYRATYRLVLNGATVSASQKAGVPLPNAWIRLTRAGDTFTTYHGTNGIDWQAYAEVTDVFPATILVGMAGAGLFEELIYIPPPEITMQPVSVVATNGDLVIFSVAATSRAEIRYQWRFNGENLTNQTNATLVLSNVHPTQEGTYQVRVANGGGAVLSAPVTLTVRVLDYGDAPATYATARHLVIPGIQLGTAVDFELNGFPSAAADGDDLNGSDDEDGVIFRTPLWVDQTATLAVIATTNGVLNGWIDYGADGGFAQPEDHVFMDFALEPGTNLLSFIVPFDAVGTNTFARFRFSTVGGLGPNGAAPDGEVEDYRVAVIPVADLSIAASGSPDPVAAGSNLTFQVTVGNVGPALANQVVVTNSFSSPVEFVLVTSSQGSCISNACSLGDLAVGGNATVTITVRPLQAGTLSGAFGIQASQPDPNTGDNLAVSSTTVEFAPTITTPPVSLTVTQHHSATFTVAVNGNAPLSYQWFHNGGALAGGTGPTLVIADALSAHEGSYQVRITNRVGGTLSQPVTLTVLEPAVIVQQPQSRTNLAGSTTNFSVAAQGTTPIFFQWLFNATNVLAGATNSSLTLSNVQLSQAGVYSVRVMNAAGAVESAAAYLTVIEIDFGDAASPFPTLLASDGARHRILPGFHLGGAVDFEPEAQANDGSDEDGVVFRSALLLGQSAQIEVTASSNGVLNAWMDWNGNGSWADVGEQIFANQIVNAGVNVLSTTVPVDAQLGARTARFRFSTAAGLSFTGEVLDGEVEDHVVTIQPGIDLRVSVVANPGTVRLGSNVVYNIQLTNAGPSTATAVVLTSSFPASVTLLSLPGACANQAGLIICELGTLAAGSATALQITTRPNEAGTVTNIVTAAANEQDVEPANNLIRSVVDILDFPAITLQPQSITVTSGDPAIFQVAATGTALNYQWTLNGANLAGATNPTLTINPAHPADEGTYRVRVSNALGEVISDPAQLTVLVPPSITSQPSSLTVTAGQDATFSVTASGTTPLQYQWTFGGVDLPGETSATLTLREVSATHEGVYRVRVSNAAGMVLSDPANLVVLIAPNITTQPQTQTVFAGANATLNVLATGTQPLSYQWFFNGANRLVGATNASLVISNAQVTHSGEYTVVVSNRVATISSSAAQLTVREADFGDAQGPSYATLLVFNAAYHYLAPGVFLGSLVDFERDGQPAANASGDDAAGQDDEDGVAFVAPLLVGQLNRVTVTASTSGFLDAWIDFNGNGDWTDLGEQIFSSRALTPGNNTLQFTIPSAAVPHDARCRFRFSTAGGLSFSGGAPNGEVEDHVASILPATDLSVSILDRPDPALVASNLHVFVTVSNAGPSPASSVVLREQLPISTTFLAATLAQGSCSNQAGVLVCDLGTIPARQSITVDIELRPNGIGVAAHRAEVSGVETDLNPTNNTMVQVTTVVAPVGPFRNSDHTVINEFGPASDYPSRLTVSGVTGTVHQVIVTLHGFSHLFPDDLDLLLVGPAGQRVVLMSDAGGGLDPEFVTFSFDDNSDLVLPDSDLIIDEPYKPTDYDDEPGDVDVFDAPAPAGPYTNRLAAFRGTDANGVWSLYIMDDFAQDAGELAGGWSLDFYVLDPFAEASAGIAASPTPAAVGQNLTYTLNVTNAGPSAVSEMLLTNVLPANVVLQSFTPSQGGCANVGQEIRCALGLMEAGRTASVTVVVTPQQIGVLSNYVRVTPSEIDLNQTNNAAFLLTPVRYFADVAITVADSIDPVPVGSSFSYILTVTNRGPQLAQAIALADTLPAGFSFASVTASQGACSNVSGTVFCDLGDLAAGDAASVIIIGQATRIGPMKNRASVSGNSVDGDLSNNQGSTDTVAVYAAPSFLNSAGITVPDPYPSTVNVSGLTGAVYKINVIVSNLNHPAPESMQLVLVGPGGQNVLLMNAVGDGFAANDATLRLDDQATVPLPDNTQLSSGTYRPASYSTMTSLPAPAPGLPYGNALAVFQGTDANGPWSLFTRGGGTIGAWGLEIFTLEAIADVRVIVVSEPASVSVGSNLTYVVTVSNRGPAIASSILLTNLLPANYAVLSATGCTNICNIGSLNAGSQVQFRVNGIATADGLATNQVIAFAAERDLNPANNVGTAVTFMKTPPLISSQPQSITVTNGDTATFTVGVSGAGPFTYQWSRNGSPLAGATSPSLVINNAQQSNAGDYAVRVSDGVGSPLSASARLTVLNRPTISDIGNIAIPEDTASAELPFAIGDLESALLTLEAASSNPQLIPVANIFVSGSGNDRSVWVLPATNQFGSATITLTVRDGDGISARDSFEVTVTPVNDRPVLGGLANVTMDEDTQRTVLLQASDIEDASAQLSLSASSSDATLLGLSIVNRTLTITGLPDQFGSARITVVLMDSAGAAVSNAFDVVISAVNDPPTLDAIAAVTLEEDAGPTVVPLTGISSGAANEPGTVTLKAITSNTNLIGDLMVSYTSGATASLTFQPLPDQTGFATITVTVDDLAPSNNIVSRTFGVSIGDVNDPPTIGPISDQVIAEDAPLQVAVTISDQESPANALTITASSSNTNLFRDANLTFAGTNELRTLTLAPEANVSGSAFITVAVTDELNVVVTRTFQARVWPVNDPPTLDVVASLSVVENSASQTVPLQNITAGASDEPHNLLVTASSSNPSLIPDPIVTYSNPNSNGSLMFTPQPDAIGTAVITIVVNDRGASNNVTVRTITVTVNDQNNPPGISRIYNQTTPENTAIDIPFLVNDTESPADSLVLSVSSANPTLASLAITGTGTNRTLRAVPAMNATGTAAITITATDTNGASSAATFILTVTPVNDPPVIGSIPDRQINEDGVLGPLFFYVNDPETPATALILSGVSSDAQLVPQSRIAFGGIGTNRWIRISPTTNRTGSVSITVTVRDADGLTASDTFLLHVQATNDPPVISAIANQTVVGGTTVTIPFTINDLETDPGVLSVVAASSNPAVLPNTNVILGGSAMDRSVQLKPLANTTGNSTVTVTVTDSGGATASRSFVVQVTSGSGPPVILTQPESQTVTNGGTATFSVAATGAPTLRYRWRFNGTNMANATNYILVITNVTSANVGNYTVAVGNNLASIISAAAALTVVSGGSPTPAINGIADQTTAEDVPLTLSLSLQDLDTPAHLLTLSATSTNNGLIPPANFLFDGAGFTRTLTIVPAANQFGTNLVTLTVTDGILSSTRSFVLRVNAVNDAPTLDRIGNVSAVANTLVSTPLTGISPGAPNETTPVNITAVHNNPGVLTNLTVNYTPGANSGSISALVLSNAVGSATITVTASDGGPSTLRTFQVVVRSPTNANPMISGITNVIVPEDTSSGPIPFTVDDPNGSPSQVTVTAVSHNTNILSASGISVAGTGANRTITLNPNTNQHGAGLITLTAADSASGVFTTNILLTVQYVNDRPLISGIANQVLTEDSPSAPIPVTVRDLETPAASLVLSGSSSNPALIPDANLLFAGSGSNRVLIVKAMDGQLGSAVITVTVADPDGGTTTTNFTATVVSGNDTPVVSDVPDVTVGMDATAGPLNFTVSDEETAAGNLSVSAAASDTSLVPLGSITLSGSSSQRTITIRPAAGRTGVSTITISASDGNAVGTKSFLLRVVPSDTNAPPSMAALSDIFVDEDSAAVNVSLSGISAGGNETGQTLAVSARSDNPDLVPDPLVTYTSPNSTGNISVSPNPGTNGVARITVTAHDGSDTFARSFNVIVRARPALSPIPNFAVNEDTTSAAIPFTVSDAETPASNLVFAMTSSNPAIIPPGNLAIGGSGTNRTLTVAGALNEFGHSVLTLSVTDGDGLSRSNSFVVIVNPVNDAPTLAPIAALTLFEDQGPLTMNITGISSGAANEAQLLMVDVASSNPAVVPVPIVSYTSAQSTGTLTFTPVPNAYGSALVTVTVNDGQAANQFVTRAFEVTVSPVDDPPTLNAIADVVLEHDAAPETLLLSGITAGHANEGQVVTVQALSSNPVVVSNLTVSYAFPNTVGTLLLAHNPGVSGTAMITVRVSDGPNTFSQTFQVTVHPAPSRLAVGSIPTQNIREDEVAGPISFYLNDGGEPAVELSAVSSNPGLVPSGRISFGGSGTNRTILLAPETNQFGSAIITIIARAGEHSASNAFQLSVSSVDDFPVFTQRVPDTVFMDEDTELTIPFFVNDAETPAHRLIVAATSYNLALFPRERIEWLYVNQFERSITFRPTPNSSGTALIELRVRDELLQRTTNNFVVVVRSVEDIPTISPIADQSVVEDAEFEAGFFVEDVETASVDLVVTAVSSDPTLLSNDSFQHINNGRTRSVRAKPALNRSGTAVVTVTVTDAGGATNSVAFSVTVSAVNDPPTITPIAPASTIIGQPTGSLPFTISDAETPANLLTLGADSSNTNLVPVSGIELGGTGTNRTLRITPASGQTGLAVITVTVGDTNGATSHTSFELLVHHTNGPPVIVLNPRDQRVNAGAEVSLRVLATGPGPLGYQWQKNGENLVGATNPILSFASAQRSDAGTYRALVSNANGSATSGTAAVEVFDGTRITSVSRTGASVEVVCESAAGQRYTLQYREDLAAGTWTDLGSIDGTGSPITFTDAAATSATRFYRVLIE